MKIFALRCLVLSQYTHLTDGQTDGQTELRQRYRALHYMQSHGKNSKMAASRDFQYKINPEIQTILPLVSLVVHNPTKVS